jgi:hypothetical protein
MITAIKDCAAGGASPAKQIRAYLADPPGPIERTVRLSDAVG